ncbi:MAG: hypothetical protein ISS35_01245 [Kiritimatiellae bacterium]|nr:hypothetical protein [Kiritimatiellia bacterium]
MTSEMEREVLVSRWRKNVYREVAREGDRIIKRYRIPPHIKRYTKPWKCEHPALVQLAALGFPKSYGYKTIQTAEGIEIVHTRDYIPGTPIETYGEQEARDMGVLLARIHSGLVVTDDAQGHNFIRNESGDMQFIDFGKARIFTHHSPRFFLRVGHELFDAKRMPFSNNRKLGRQLIDAYMSATSLSPITRNMVQIGITSAAFTRWFKNTLHLRTIKHALRRIGSRQGAARSSNPQKT